MKSPGGISASSGRPTFRSFDFAKEELMPMERVPKRVVRDCLRLKSGRVSTREIARRIGVAPSTVRLTLRRCEPVWPLDAALTDTMLEQRLFANVGKKHGHRRALSRSRLLLVNRLERPK